MGRQCDVTDCRAMTKPDTTLSGTVFAPNGTLKLSGINVYIPAVDPGPIAAGLTCMRCSDELPGNPVVKTVTDEQGRFSLVGVPAGDNIPLVITSGKWRRIVTLPHVDSCTETELPALDTRLPKNRSEGDMPTIAITTGAADSLECLVKKLGVDPLEITNEAGGGRVQLFAGSGGKDTFAASFPGSGGKTLGGAQALWGDYDHLSKYDIVMFSCEGAQVPAQKPQAAMDAVKKYADNGGRLFASHWHNVWFEGGHDEDPSQTQTPDPAWRAIGNWTNRDPSELDANSSALIDEQSNPKGRVFADWMLANGGSTTRDVIALQNEPPDQNGKVISTGRTSLQSTAPNKTERWVYLPDQGQGTQNFQFTTPIEQDDVTQRCGKVVFSDMHVSGTSGDGDYPDSCHRAGQGDDELTPQEKALAYMFFDIATCVGILL